MTTETEIKTEPGHATITEIEAFVEVESKALFKKLAAQFSRTEDALSVAVSLTSTVIANIVHGSMKEGTPTARKRAFIEHIGDNIKECMIGSVYTNKSVVHANLTA